MVEKTQSKQTQVEEKPFKKLRSSIPTTTLDLTHLEREEEIISPVHVTVEIDNGLQNITSGNNGKSSSPPPQPQPSCLSTPSSSAILFSSIMALS